MPACLPACLPACRPVCLKQDDKSIRQMMMSMTTKNSAWGPAPGLADNFVECAIVQTALRNDLLAVITQLHAIGQKMASLLNFKNNSVRER